MAELTAPPKWAVQAPDGKVIQFPDNFTDQDVNREMSKMYSSQTQAAPAPARALGPQDQGRDVIGPREPSMWDRARSAMPILDRIQSGISGPAQTNQEALAKPAPGMQTEQAVQPQNLMTPQQQKAHPIATGAAEFAGGMSTPGNMLLTGMTAGPLPGALARPLGAMFSGAMLKNAYEEYPDFKAAVDRRDINEMERIGTHLVLGASLAALGGKQSATGVSPYETYAASGREFNKVKNINKSIEGIETNGVGLYNRVRDAIITHKAVLEKQGSDALQPSIEADKVQSGGKGSISTAGAIGEAAKAIAKTGYTPKPAERILLDKISGTASNNPVIEQTAQNLGYQNSTQARNGLGAAVWDGILKKQGLESNPGALSLEEAKLLRTAVGRVAFGKNAAPESKAVFTAAYNELTNAMQERVTELDGHSKRFDFYNNRFKMSHELNKGIAGDLLDSLQGQDASASIDPLKKFSRGNIKEIQQQMRQTGNGQLADQLGKSQRDAKALVAGHSSQSGQFASSAMRLLMQHPKESWPAIVAMAAAHGIGLPFPLPQLAGAGVGYLSLKRALGGPAAEVGARLQRELPPEKFQTRTGAMSGDFGVPGGGSTGAGGGGSPSSPAPTTPSGKSTAYRDIRDIPLGESMRRTPEATAQDVVRTANADPRLAQIEEAQKARAAEMEKKYPVKTYERLRDPFSPPSRSEKAASVAQARAKRSR